MSSCAGQPLVLCKTRRGSNRQSGPFTEYIYEGDHDSIYGLSAEIDTEGKADDWQIDHDGNKYQLKARYSDNQSGTGNETPVDEVRLHGNRVMQPIYDHPKYAAVTAEEKRTIRNAIQNPTPGDDPEDDLSVLGFELYNLLLLGVAHFIVYQPILVRVRIASATFDFTHETNTAYEKVGRIIKPASISADAALGDNAYFGLPAAGDDIAGKAWGWLKHYPEYTQAAGNKGVLTQEWEFGLWSTAIYGDPV